MERVHANRRFSADVRMHLESGGQVHPVAEIGPNSMMLRLGQPIPPNGHARLVVEIDGDRTVQDVTVTCIDRDLPELSFA